MIRPPQHVLDLIHLYYPDVRLVYNQRLGEWLVVDGVYNPDRTRAHAARVTPGKSLRGVPVTGDPSNEAAVFSYRDERGALPYPCADLTLNALNCAFNGLDHKLIEERVKTIERSEDKEYFDEQGKMLGAKMEALSDARKRLRGRTTSSSRGWVDQRKLDNDIRRKAERDREPELDSYVSDAMKRGQVPIHKA